MDVIEHRDDGSLQRERLEEPPDRPRRFDGAASADAEDIRQLGGDRLRRPAHPPTPCGGLPALAQAVAFIGDPCRLDRHLGDRPERDALAVGETPAGEQRRPSIDQRSELAGQSGLPDTRRAEDREEVARAIGNHALEGVEESRATARSRPIIGASSLRSCPATPFRTETSRYAPTASALPFRASGSTGSASTASRDELERALPDQDLARGRRLLEPGGRVDRVAGDEPLVPTSVSRDDLAGVDARPHVDRDAELRVEVAVQVGQGLAHLGCCAHRPDSVVLVESEARRRPP